MLEAEQQNAKKDLIPSTPPKNNTDTIDTANSSSPKELPTTELASGGSPESSITGNTVGTELECSPQQSQAELDVQDDRVPVIVYILNYASV